MIGLRSRGTDHAKLFAANPGAEVVAVCDIDDAMFAKPRQGASRRSPAKPPRTEKDFRRLLDDKSIDAITIATPDHWHALLTVLACQAGKDVYVEKPASHNMVEGRRMVEAARKYNRIVQLGTQRRSMPHVEEAIARVRRGGIGKVGMARAWIHQEAENIGHGKPGPVPRRRRLRHVARARARPPVLTQPLPLQLALVLELGHRRVRQQRHPRRRRRPLGPRRRRARSPSVSGGGKYVFDDDQEVPDTQLVTWEFPNACLVWEHRMWSKHPTERQRLRHRLLRRQGDPDYRRPGLADRGRRRLQRQAVPASGQTRHTSRTSSTASRAARSRTPISRSAI